ncbi:MAG: hypothetical protein JW884_01700 [Deltaproteobacteria bacterium]|nr:hypothetical protein [Deltaproteobacteria bacterium]
MMIINLRKIFVLIVATLCVGALFLLPSAGAATYDATGFWSFTITGAWSSPADADMLENVSGWLQINQTGDSFTGAINGDLEISGVIDGSDYTCSGTIEEDGETITVNISLTLSSPGTSGSGTVTVSSTDGGRGGGNIAIAKFTDPVGLYRVYISHITRDTSQAAQYPEWVDILQVDNTSNAATVFTIILYNDAGVKVFEQTYPIDQLGYDAIDIKTLNASAETGEILYDSPSLNFRLFYEYEDGGVAEFNLMESKASTVAFYFANAAAWVQYKGLALMNAGAMSTTVTLYAIGEGEIRSTSLPITIPAKTRIFGLHSEYFPYEPVNQINKIIAVSSNGQHLAGITKSTKFPITNILFTSALPAQFTAP